MPYQSWNVLAVLQELNQGSFVVHIKGTDYSPSFIAYFLQLLSEHDILVKHYSLEEFIDQSSLQQSVFESNQPTLLFLGHIESAEQYKSIKKLLSGVSTQSICFFYNKVLEGLKRPVLELHLDSLSTAGDIQKLWNSFDTVVTLPDTIKKHVSTLLIRHYTSLSVEQACSLLKYMPLMQTFSEHQLLEIISSLLVKQHSLFELSALFFAHNNIQFFKKWSEIEPLYPPIFWINYWSDQLFRAYCYTYAKQTTHDVPKSAGARLPFSFVNKDYKLVNLKNLINMHAILRAHDQRLKQGYTADVTLVLHQWFLE